MPERRDAELVRADNDHADRADNDDLDKDRRRSPRFRCGGHAEINCLPSSGILLPGTIRDLSLHGCCVDTSLPIDCGVRAELVVRVNAASFRAVGEIRAVRGRSGAALEFIHLSAGGKDTLAVGGGFGEIASGHEQTQIGTPQDGCGVVPKGSRRRETSTSEIDRAVSFLEDHLASRALGRKFGWNCICR
jgi:hypothetical protein